MVTDSTKERSGNKTAPFLLLFITQPQPKEKHKHHTKGIQQKTGQTAKPNRYGKIKVIRLKKGKTAENKPNGKQ